MSSSIIKKSAVGSFYVMIVSMITLVLGFVRTILVMRLLGADSFGIITLALFFSKLILPFSSLGLDHALLQKKEPSPLSYSSHFVLRIGASLVIGLLCLSATPFLTIRYGTQLVNIFMIFLSINFLDSTYATHFVKLRREMRFGALAIINLCASVLMTIVTPVAAFMGAGIWSLVIEQALGPIVRWMSVWVILRPWNVSVKIGVSEAHSHIKFGSQIIYGNLLGTILDRFDDFWIGTTLGSKALGFYSRAYELTQYPERVMSSPISTVFMSVYAAVQNKRQELSIAFFRSSSFLIRLGFLINAILVTVAPELVILLFTDKWLPLAPIFRLMVVYLIFDPLYINTCTLMIGIGQPKIVNWVRLVQIIVFIPSVIFLAKIWGTYGVAMAANIMMVVGVISLLIASKRLIDYSLLRMLLWPTIAMIASCLMGWLADNMVTSNTLMLVLLLKTVLVLGIYIFVLIIGEWKDIQKYGLASINPMIKHLTGYFNK